MNMLPHTPMVTTLNQYDEPQYSVTYATGRTLHAESKAELLESMRNYQSAYAFFCDFQAYRAATGGKREGT